MPHVEKRGPGRYRARYRRPDGKEQSRTFSKKAAAERWLTSQEAAKLRGEWIDPTLGKQRFESYATQWLTTKTNVAPRTYINVDGRLRNHVLPYFKTMTLQSVTPADIRDWLGKTQSKGIAPSTIKAAYQVLDQILNQATIDGLISRSPCVGVQLPKDRRHAEVCFLTPAEVAALAEATDPRFKVFILTAAYTGMRAGELAALKLDRLNLLHGTIEVRESLSEVRGKPVVGPTKTGKPRTITVPRFLSELLATHISTCSANGYVFTSPNGGPHRHRNFYARFFKPAVRSARLPTRLRFHDLRHTCAAILIANGRHMEEVKEYLGHSSIRVTSDRYGHLFPAAKQALADSLNETYLRVVEASERARSDSPADASNDASASFPAACPRPGRRSAAVRRAGQKAKSTLDQDVRGERTTGFEPATLTLAR